MIVATLNIAGDSAGMKNRCSEFSMPMNAAASATNVRNGSMIRVRNTVSSSLPGTSRYAPAKSADERLGEDDPEDDERAGDDDQCVDDVGCRAATPSPCPSVVRCRVNVGTNALLIAPSAKRSRTRLGMRKATL